MQPLLLNKTVSVLKLVVTLLLFSSCLLVSAQDIEVDSLLQRHFETAGDRPAWESLESWIVEYSSFFAPVYKSPHERQLGDESYGHSKTYYQPFDRYRCESYESDTLRSVTIANRKEVEYYDYTTKQIAPISDNFREHLLFYELSNLVGITPYILQALDKGKVEYKGITKAYDKACHTLLLKFDNPAAKWDMNVYLDTTTYLVYATSSLRKEENHELYDNYRSIDGLMIPHRNISYFNKALQAETTIIEVEINQPLNDSLFEVGAVRAKQ